MCQLFGYALPLKHPDSRWRSPPFLYCRTILHQTAKTGFIFCICKCMFPEAITSHHSQFVSSRRFSTLQQSLTESRCQESNIRHKFLFPLQISGVADLGYEGLNMQVRETSIHKTWGFSSYFFHTLIKQRPFSHSIDAPTTTLERKAAAKPYI